MIPKFIDKRNDFLISNHYEKMDDHGFEFNVILYYIDDFKFKYIIRRLDRDDGWDIQLKIRLYSEHQDDFEVISLGDCRTNTKKGEIETTLHIGKAAIRDQCIPRRIMQTSFSNKIHSIQHENAFRSFIEFNPEYEYEFFDDLHCRMFISKFFDKNVLKAYDILRPGAFKSDLFRLCYIYINGGCYFDNKHVLRIPLSKIITPEMKNLYCNETFREGLHNGIIISIKQDRDVYSCIMDIVFNTLSYKMESHSLAFTGPIKLYSYAKDKNIGLKFVRTEGQSEFYHDQIYYMNRLVVNRSYQGYYSENHRREDYDSMFRESHVYLYNYQEDDSFIYMRTPIYTIQKIYKLSGAKSGRLMRKQNMISEEKKIIVDDNIVFKRLEKTIHIIDNDHYFLLFVINKNTHQIKKYDVYPLQKQIHL